MLQRIKAPSSFFDLSLRVTALGGKFLLMLAIARYLTIKDVGDYGVFVSIIVISLYFVGLDFYVYSTREMLDPKVKKNTGSILFNQAAFFVLSYCLLAFAWPGLLSLSGVSGVGGILFALTVSEHLSQECYRVLIIKEKITIANFTLLIRSGLWCYICVPLLFYKLIDLKQIFYLWLLFSLLSVIVSSLFISKFENIKFSDFNLDFRWLSRGVKTSFYFFLGTLCLRAINYFDKVIAVHFIPSANLGVYVFFFGISSAVQAVIDVLVVTRYYPALVKAIQEENREKIKVAFCTFKKKIYFYNFVLFFLSIPACYLMIKFTGKIDYIEHFSWYFLIVITSSLLNVSMPYHYALYSRKKDLTIILINVIALLLFVIISFIGLECLPGKGMLPILIALVGANFFMLAAKYLSFIKEFNSEGHHFNK